MRWSGLEPSAQPEGCALVWSGAQRTAEGCVLVWSGSPDTAEVRRSQTQICAVCTLGVIPTFLPQPHQQRATHFNSQCMLHAALLMPAYWQTSFRFAGRVARLRHDELHSGAPAAHPALGTGNSMHSSSLTADQVSWRVPLNSATLRSMLCCFCCLPAARALGLLPSASPRKSGDQSRTISPTVPVLADAIGSYSTRLHGGEGGSKATAAAPECLGARP